MSYRFKELYSGGEGGGGIIEVDSLPTENIEENAFYLVGGRYYKWVDGDWQEYVLASTGGGIIKVDAFPTENIDENVFYVIGGKYYRWEKSNALVFNDVIHIPEEMYNTSYYFEFSINAPNGDVLEFNEMAFDCFGEVSFYKNGAGIESAYSGGWQDENYKTITIHKMPTIELPMDEVFIAWLKSNSTVFGVWHKYVPTPIDDIIGTWVFDDKLSIPDEFYGNEYHFKFTVHSAFNIEDVEYTAFRFYDDGLKYIEYVTVDGGCDSVHQEGVGWFSDMQAHKTIDIHEVPDDEAFITWLIMNATKQASASTGVGITVVDELPTKKIRQNTIYRKDDKYYKRNETNIWVFEDELSITAEMRGNEYSIGYSVNTPNDGVQTFDSIVFSDDGAEVAFYRNSDVYFIDCVYGDGWQDEIFKTITITEMPTDEVFLEWLRANATAEGSWEEYAETTSITPTASETWVFNDELTSLDKPFANGYEDVACSGYMLYDKIDEPFNYHFTSIRFYPDSVNLRNSDTDGIGIYYIDNFTYNFRHATITFTELPDDEVFIAWLKENATKMSGGSSDTGATAYTAKSVDELPNDAPDGSLALVESDSIVGDWELKDKDNPLDLSMLNIPDGIYAGYEINGHEPCAGVFLSVWFRTNSDYGDFCFGVGYSPVYMDGYFDDDWGVFSFYTPFHDYDDPYVSREQFMSFMHANFNRISGGYSLYIRKNGEWVYEREADMGGDSDADDSIVGTWVFKDELTKPDEMPINSYCDYYANTSDGLQRMNEVYISFVDEENSDNFTISYYGDEYSVDDVYEKDYGWSEEKYKTIKILTEPTDQTFIAWLKANATKQASESTGAITEIQTPEELDSILANATSSDVGKAYIFVGESNGKYKNNSIYIIREV